MHDGSALAAVEAEPKDQELANDLQELQNDLQPAKKPPTVTAQDIMEEFRLEKERLVGHYQKKKMALDARGVFNSEINMVRAENMLLSAIGKINMSALQRRAREKLQSRSEEQPEGVKPPPKYDTTMVDKLEKRLNGLHEQSLRCAYPLWIAQLYFRNMCFRGSKQMYSIVAS